MVNYLLIASNQFLKYGTTLVEVDIDGSWSYPEPQVNATDNGKLHFCLCFLAISLFIWSSRQGGQEGIGTGGFLVFGL